MKKLLFLLSMLIPLMTEAETVEINGICYAIIAKANLAEVISSPFGYSYSGIVDIPESITYEGAKYNVVTIGKAAFSGCKGLTSITIPNSVTTIEEGAFSGCEGLNTINIPNSVTSIKDLAFQACTNLKSIYIGDGVKTIGAKAFFNCDNLKDVYITNLKTWCQIKYKSDYRQISANSNPLSKNGHLYLNGIEIKDLIIPDDAGLIEEYAFYGCSSFITVKIPKDVTSIGSNSFGSCKSLEELQVENGVQSIDEGAFSNCSRLSSAYIPNSVKYIGKEAFSGCQSLIDFTIPSYITSVEVGVFRNCKSLRNVTIPNSVERIGGSSFENCTSITTLIIPNSVTSIESSFIGCTSLEFIYLPNSLLTIGSSAFENCKNLKNVIIGNKTKDVGYRAFANCPELSEVYCLSESVPNCGNETFEDSYIEYATLYVPEASLDKYQSADPWSRFKSIAKISSHEHTIIYLIDGMVYKIYHVEEGETLNCEPSPTREGYTFSGWSEIPETMPDRDIFVSGTFRVNKSYMLTCIMGSNSFAIDVPFNYQLKDKLDEIILAHSMEQPLINEVEQFSSPCSDIQEGKDFGALLDNNASTYWLSDWRGNYKGGAHYFQVEMKDEYSEMCDSLFFEFTRCGVEYDHTIEWLVCGTNNFNAELGECEELLHAYTPYDGVVSAVVSSPFPHKDYKYLRFYSINLYPSYRVYFQLSEFQIHPYQKTPLKEGYTFAGWTLDNGAQLPATMPDHDISVIANFIPSTYYITYMIDGKEYKTTQYACGSTITPEAEPTKEGYTFCGWSEIPKTMPAHDVVVTGTFITNYPNGQCEKPSISYSNGKLKYECETSGVEFVSEITDDDIKTHLGDEIGITATYTINVIAKADGYKDSEPATATLCWIDVEPYTEGTKEAEDKVTEVRAIPILVQTEGNTIRVQGAAEGTEISVCNTAGIKLGSTIANNGTTTLNTQLLSGSTVIVKIGGKKVKVQMK